MARQLTTLSGDMEKQLLHQDLQKERDSDEDGGVKTRVEMDSDFSLSEPEENARDDARDAADAGKEQWSDVLTKVRSKHNTGPKGVKADYEEAKRITRRRNETKRLQDLEAFRTAAYGASTADASVSFAAQAEEGKILRARNRVQAYDADNDDDDDDDGEDDDTAAAIQEMRRQRLAQFSSLRELPQHGRLIAVDKFQFLDEVDNADPRTFVVTHLYEDYIAACRDMNQALETLAARQPHVKFLKLVATDASQTLSHRALPAFLVYRNKEMVEDSSVSVNESRIGGAGRIAAAELEFFLASRYGIPLAGVDVSSVERSEQQRAALEEEALAESGSAGRTTLGRVDLLRSRVAKATLQDNDDDW